MEGQTRPSGLEMARDDPPATRDIQGYLAHKKRPPHRTLQEDCAKGFRAVLREGGVLTSEVQLNMFRCGTAQWRGGRGVPFRKVTAGVYHLQENAPP